MKALYDLLEVKFDPLSLGSLITPLLQSLSATGSSEPSTASTSLSQPTINYAPYLPLLHQAVLSRLLSHLSQVYSSIKVTRVLELVAPIKAADVEGAYEEAQIEAYIMGCARRGELNIRVDHADGCIHFIDEPFAGVNAAPEDNPLFGKSSKEAIQAPLSELVRTKLGGVASCLHNSLQLIDGPPAKPTPEEQQSRFSGLLEAVAAERKALQIRRAIVARRREMLSELSVRKEQEQTIRRAEYIRKEKEAEQKRALEDSRNREIERNRKERENIRLSEAKKYAQSLLDIGILKANDVEVRFFRSSIFITQSATETRANGDVRYRGAPQSPSAASREGEEGDLPALTHRR